MANEILKRDVDRVTVLGAVTDDGNQFITQLRVDPTTGRLKVSATGITVINTNTLGQEVPTGTVNGTNKVFTVQNNPVFGEVSGQIMVSSVQNPSNYGYTITGTGPYTITYVNAPTQTPDSFYNFATAGSALASFFQTDSFTSTLNQTVFTTTLTPLFVFGIYQNGQLLTPITDYTQLSSTFTLTSGAVTGDKIEITYLHS